MKKNKTMLAYVTLVMGLHLVLGADNKGMNEEHCQNIPQSAHDNFLPSLVKTEIMRTFPGVNDATLLIDFLANETYMQTLVTIQVQMCYFDLIGKSKRSKRSLNPKQFLPDCIIKLFPSDFWVKDVHHGYYHYLKHLDPWRWWDEAYGFLEIKSSLPPLYYVAKYAPEELRFLKNNDYHEEYFANLTWPPGLDPFWTGNPNMTTNLVAELTSSSSSEDASNGRTYSGETTHLGTTFED